MQLQGLCFWEKTTQLSLRYAISRWVSDDWDGIQGRVATVQSLAETGALRLAAAFLQRFFPEKAVYVSTPAEKTPKSIFADAGVPWKSYRYLNRDTYVVDFEGMVADLTDAPDGSVVLLNGIVVHVMLSLAFGVRVLKGVDVT